MPIRPHRTTRRLLGTVVLATVFAPMLGVAVSTAAYAGAATDEPGTVAMARSQRPAETGRWLSGSIDSDHDSDVRRVQLRATSTVLITVAAGPGDHRLTLHRRDGTILARSDQPGTEFEQLAPRLPAGQYFVAVTAAHPGAYQLMIRVLPDRTTVLDSHRQTTPHLTAVTGQLVNNAGSWQRRPVVSARFYDRHGDLVGTATALAERTLLAPGERAAFRIVSPPMPDAVRHVVRVQSQWTTPPADRPTLTAASDQPYALDDGRIRHAGRVTASAQPPGPIHVHVLRYNAAGALVDFGHAILAVSPDHPAHYEIDLPRYRYTTTTRVTLSEG